jgi:hypothetical protein
VKLGRNGAITDGWGMGTLADALNMLASRRLHVLASWGVRAASPGVPQDARGYFHTSPNCRRVEAVIIAAKSNANPTAGYYEWTVNGSALPRRYFGGTSGSSSAPNEIVVDRQALLNGTSIGDTTNTVSLTVNTDMRVYAVIIYERPLTALYTDSSAVVVDPAVFKAGAPILDRDIAALTDGLWKLYRRQGTHHFAWTNLASGGAASRLGTTFANILDGTTTGYGANAAGFWTIPHRRGRLATAGLEAVFWCRSRISGGAGTGRVRLVNSAGTLVTITGITGATITTYTGTCTLDTTLSSDLVVVEQSGSDAGTTVETYACGLYEYKT